LISKKIEEFRDKNKDAKNLDQMAQDYKLFLPALKVINLPTVHLRIM